MLGCEVGGRRIASIGLGRGDGGQRRRSPVCVLRQTRRLDWRFRGGLAGVELVTFLLLLENMHTGRSMKTRRS